MCKDSSNVFMDAVNLILICGTREMGVLKLLKLVSLCLRAAGHLTEMSYFCSSPILLQTCDPELNPFLSRILCLLVSSVSLCQPLGFLTPYHLWEKPWEKPERERATDMLFCVMCLT